MEFWFSFLEKAKSEGNTPTRTKHTKHTHLNYNVRYHLIQYSMTKIVLPRMIFFAVLFGLSLPFISGFSVRNYGISSSVLPKTERSPRFFGRGPSFLAMATTQLDDKQLDLCMGYLNKHHSDVLVTFVGAFTDLGRIQAKRNGFSGGSYKITEAKLVGVDSDNLELEVTVKDRGEPEPVLEHIFLSLDADTIDAKKSTYITTPNVLRNEANPVDDLVRRLNRLCLIAKYPSVTGKLIQLGIQIGGSGVGALPEDMYLNQLPHNRYVRDYFYSTAAKAVHDAVVLCSEGKISNRMKVVSLFPELNSSMDSYRIGTLLELVRTIAIALAEENLRVRICIQGSMGVGIFTATPKQLNGAMNIIQKMDWQSGEGEVNDGMVGTYVNFGGIGKEHVVNAHTDREGNHVEQDDVFIIICPQSMVGVDASIMGPLAEMVGAAGDRPVVLINPDLTDKVSTEGQQSVRGRKERIEFSDSFNIIHQFKSFFSAGNVSALLGSITKLNPTDPWVVHQRRDLMGEQGEIYVPVLSTEEMPGSELILENFE